MIKYILNDNISNPPNGSFYTFSHPQVLIVVRLRESSNFCYSTYLKQKLQGTKVTAIYTWISQ